MSHVTVQALPVQSAEMRVMKEAVAVVVTFLANALPPAHAKGGGGGGGGGWGGGGSSASATAAAKAGGGSRATSRGGGKWNIASDSTSAKGSSLYKDSSGRARSGRPRYYGAGHSNAGRAAADQGKSFTKRAILWSAVAGATVFLFYSASQRASLAPDCPRGIRVRARSCTQTDKLTDDEHPNVYRPVPVRT